MRLELSPDSRVLVDLRATGLLRAVAHDPTLSAVAPPLVLALPDADGPVDVAVDAQFAVDAIEPPADIRAADRDQMRDNLRAANVLDSARWPTLDFRGRYAGTLSRGTLSGDLVVRGVPRPIAVDVTVSREAGRFVARGTWEGRLTQLGVKPFQALLGALKLKDWIRLRLQLVWTVR
jgi:polyisoprenoid-binding protein YceI